MEGSGRAPRASLLLPSAANDQLTVTYSNRAHGDVIRCERLIELVLELLIELAASDFWQVYAVDVGFVHLHQHTPRLHGGAGRGIDRRAHPARVGRAAHHKLAIAKLYSEILQARGSHACLDERLPGRPGIHLSGERGLVDLEGPLLTGLTGWSRDDRGRHGRMRWRLWNAVQKGVAHRSERQESERGASDEPDTPSHNMHLNAE